MKYALSLLTLLFILSGCSEVDTSNNNSVSSSGIQQITTPNPNNSASEL